MTQKRYKKAIIDSKKKIQRHLTGIAINSELFSKCFELKPQLIINMSTNMSVYFGVSDWKHAATLKIVQSLTFR